MIDLFSLCKEITLILDAAYQNIFQKEIFQNFFRAHNIHDINGTGLGLYIVKSVVEKLHGKISFKSISAPDTPLKTKYHTGTKFSVALPYTL